jgi:Ala-tRNA(Pro) deacylase
MPCEKLLAFLESNHVDFELVEHPPAYAAREVAAKTGVPGRAFAKAVVVSLDGKLAMAVLPAEQKISFNQLRDASGASTISLTVEDEFAERFPDCELGAMPPFGNLYDMPVYVDDHLIDMSTISFNAGTHAEVVTMAYRDFARLVQPQIARFTFRPLQEYRAWS